MIKPIGKRLFIKQDPQPEKKGDIILLEKKGMLAPPYSGTVISVGDEVEDKDFQPGVKILYHDLAGTEIIYKDETFINLREHDITAIILDKNVQIV
jgi:co-chaperonin GroES (HSP10)